MLVPVPQHIPRLLLEAITGLFAVPDGAGQRELPAYPVLAHGAQGSTSQFLGLQVVGLQPQTLQLGVVGQRERVALQQFVEVLEVTPMKTHHRFSLEHGFVLV